MTGIFCLGGIACIYAVGRSAIAAVKVLTKFFYRDIALITQL